MKQQGFDFEAEIAESAVQDTSQPQSLQPPQSSDQEKTSLAAEQGHSDHSNSSAPSGDWEESFNEVFEVSANIPTSYLSRVFERLNKANKRLEKLNRPAFSIELGQRFTDVIDVDVRSERIRTSIDVTPVKITGTPYKYGNYRLLGAVYHDETPALQTQFGQDNAFTLLDEDQRLSCECDHCGTNRNRSKLFFVQKFLNDESGRMKPEGPILRLGGSCVSEFLDGFSPEAVASSISVEAEAERIAREIANIGEDYGDQERMAISHSDGISTLKAVALAHKIIDKYGYTSKATAEYLYITSTAQEVMHLLGASTEDNLSDAEIERAKETIGNAIEALSKKSADSLTDFDLNLKSALECELVTKKFLGHLAYTPVYLERERAKELKEELAQSSKHFGEEGQRITCPIRFIQSNSFEGRFGTTFFHKFITSEGNSLTISSSLGQKSLGIKRDCWLYGAFTIKGHKKFQNVHETEATRLNTIYNFGMELPSKSSIEHLESLAPLLKMIDSPYTKKAESGLKKNADLINESPLLQERVLQFVMGSDFGSRGSNLEHFQSLGIDIKPETSVEFSFLGWAKENAQEKGISFRELALDGQIGASAKERAIETIRAESMTVELNDEDAIENSDFARIGQLIQP